MAVPTGPDTATRDREARPGGRRRLTAVCGALVGSAAALQGAAQLAWFTGGVDAVGRGTVAVTARGADLVPALTAVALLAVAAVAAAVALAGPLRRVLGGLVVAAGSGIGVAVVGLLLVPPTTADLAALPGAPTGATPAPDVPVQHAGPLVGVLGAALLLAAGIVLLSTEHRLPRLGTRYTVRSGAGRSGAGRDGAGRDGAGRDGDAPVVGPAGAGPPEGLDPDRAAWDALDAGHDPTADGPTADGPTADGPTADGPTADRPGVGHPTAARPPADPSGVDRPGGVRPAVARPSTDPGRTDDGGSDRAV